MTCGYSPIAMLLVIIAGLIMLFTAFFSGRIKLKSSMPVAASCSAAIAAACHPGGDSTDGEVIAMLKLRWGAVPGITGEVGHCLITDREVVEPQDGSWYAGVPKTVN